MTLTCRVALNANLCGMALAVGWEDIGSHILKVGIATEMEFEVNLLEENCELRRTDNVQGQMSKNIFATNGGHCV